jgi:hypothetical protein
MRVRLMVNIYCPACKVSSPREKREIAHASPICKVCGARLNGQSVEAALGLYIEPQETTGRRFDHETPAFRPRDRSGE